MSEPAPKTSILIVDDTPANLQLLAGMLQERGYNPRPVPSGRLALKAAESQPPDLILLDINMPEMNGFEVCEKLKADERFKDIPVIFISALSETTDKVKALAVGGVDYITKPFAFAEVEARVATHLRLRRMQLELEENYVQLRDLERMRDSLVHMIIHDMRTPLSVVKGNLDLIPMIAEGSDLFAELADPLNSAERATTDVIDMVTNLLDISRMEEGRMPLNPAPHKIADLLESCRSLVEVKAKERGVALQVGSTDVEIDCDGELIQRVLVNLTANALKFSPPDSTVQLNAMCEDDGLKVLVKDSGPGIPPEYQAKVFEKFGQVEAHKDRKKYSTGLGLTFCKMAVEAHDGTIGVESDGETGSTFWFTLPAG